MKFSDLKIGTRLGAGFAIVLTMLIVVAGLGISRMAMIENHMEDITKGNNVQSQLASEMHSTVAERMIALRNVVLLSEEADMKAELAAMQDEAAHYAAAETRLNAMFGAGGAYEEEKAAMAGIREQETAAAPIIAKVLELGMANKNEEATKLVMKEMRPVQQKWMAKLAELVAIEARQNDETVLAAESAYLTARIAMLILSAVAIFAGAAVALLITRGITGPINTAVQIARTVAGGDLTSKIEVTSHDETGLLLQALKDMNQSLQKIVSQVRQGTDTIATASTQIASGNMDLSARTEAQAGSLEETASSMEELTSTVKQNAENARQANGLAVSASDIAGRGGLVVSQVIDTMGSINASAKKIVDIISVIDGIAFQTNILALNAAVEAARAGEQGRGFAVVATEVRNLAQRSAAAAKEIKGLINDSVEKVDMGARLVDEAGNTMSEVVASVKRVSDIISEITAASLEQTSGIEQINQAIMQMDNVTQQNAALVEEAAAAAESLQDQAGNLTEIVSTFTLEPSTNAFASPRASSGGKPDQPGRVLKDRLRNLRVPALPTPAR